MLHITTVVVRLGEEQAGVDAQGAEGVAVEEGIDACGKVSLGLLGEGKIATLEEGLDELATLDLHEAMLPDGASANLAEPRGDGQGA